LRHAKGDGDSSSVHTLKLSGSASELEGTCIPYRPSSRTRPPTLSSLSPGPTRGVAYLVCTHRGMRFALPVHRVRAQSLTYIIKTTLHCLAQCIPPTRPQPTHSPRAAHPCPQPASVPDCSHACRRTSHHKSSPLHSAPPVHEHRSPVVKSNTCWAWLSLQGKERSGVVNPGQPLNQLGFTASARAPTGPAEPLAIYRLRVQGRRECSYAA
jgi:hypothetical protein